MKQIKFYLFFICLPCHLMKFILFLSFLSHNKIIASSWWISYKDLSWKVYTIYLEENVKPFKQKLSYQGKEHQRLIIHRKKAHIFIKASHNNTVIMPITSKICIRDAIQQYYKVLLKPYRGFSTPHFLNNNDNNNSYLPVMQDIIHQVNDVKFVSKWTTVGCCSESYSNHLEAILMTTVTFFLHTLNFYITNHLQFLLKNKQTNQ